MKIPLKDIIVLFQKMQEQVNISYVSIVIFVAVDVDSICTLKIFSKIFKYENIQYKVYPVTTYSQLGSRIEEVRAYEQVKMFMFINCGGIIDLTEYWIVQQKQASILLFDVNKPIHHKNLESEDIKVIDDGLSEFHNHPSSQQLEKLNELNEYDFDEQEDQEQRLGDSPKRAKTREFRQKLKKHKELIEFKYNNYYSKQFFGYPSSYSAYRLVRDLQKNNNDFLWYAIVGVTSMYLEQKITKEVLESVCDIYSADTAKLNAAVIGRKEKGEVSVCKGFQFTLLDHWSLYESMLNSNYMMINLRLWDEKGLGKLNEFIHNIGISLQDAKQLYKYMPRETQRKLNENIVVVAEKFNLLEVVYMSFQRQVDYSAAYMASDYHYVLTSALEAPPPHALPFEQLPEHRVACFWRAYDTFEAPLKELTARIEESKKMSYVLMRQAKNLLERDHLITMDKISIANIRNDTDDKKIFEHPSALIRLAYLLMGILKVKKNAKSYKPFVANWIDLEKEVCTCVGVMNESKNSIGTRFNEIAERLKIEVSHDNFMPNIIMIKKDDLTEFIKEIGMTQ